MIKECRDYGKKDCTQEDRDKLYAEHIRNIIIVLVILVVVVAGVVVLSCYLASRSPDND